MTISQANFEQLFRRLADIDLFGSGPPDVPWGKSEPEAKTVRAATDPVSSRLPMVYQRTYIRPLNENLDFFLRQVSGQPETLECIVGAIYDHAIDDIDPELDRFLAVISNFYRSFLDAQRRLAAGFPPVQQLPPLAMFQHDGSGGPFTIPVDQVQELFGGSVGVVSLPSVYRRHPLLWTSLAHETGGHDVLHAEADLLPELGNAVQALFGGRSAPASGQSIRNQLLGLLWSWWIDEAASDVYGVMNMGPEFGLNLVAFFSALNERTDPTGTPTLRTFSGEDRDTGWLDPHPTDILRPFLMKGAIEALQGLSADRRKRYADDLVQLAQLTGADAPTIGLQGNIVTPSGARIHVERTVPMDLMQASAHWVGSLIASGTFQALGNNSIQALETWDDADEDTALGIADNLKADHSVADQGDDAALLAGANITAFDQPGSYDTITVRLNEALDRSFATDPFWGWTQRLHRTFVATRSLLHNPAEPTG